MPDDSNDLYPNDGSYFQPQEPEAQALERRVEKSKAQAAKPMLEDLVAKIAGDIDAMDRVSAIKITAEADPEAFFKAWYGVQERAAYAAELKTYVESLLATTS